MDINDKKITILGAVRSGIGAARLSKKLGALPFVSELSPKEKLAQNFLLLEMIDVPYETGGHTDKVFDCDLMIVSPGIPENAPVIIESRKKGIKIVSEIEFASWYCKGTIIAITGTNGKTTTTTMCDYVLNMSGRKCYAAGNIGYAFSEIVLDVKEDEFVSLEVSSFQLDNIDKFSPAYSMILNVTPDHLDRYNNSFEEYKNSKAAVYRNQKQNNFFIFNNDDINVPKPDRTDNPELLGFSLKDKLESGCYLFENNFTFTRNGKAEVVCNTSEVSLRGEHNYANIMAVINVVKLIGLSNAEIKNALGKFPGVEHRLEFIRALDGVIYINDSKATNVDAVWYALRSFDQPILLILGGKDKGNDYNQIKDLVKEHVKKIYAVGSSAEKVYNFFNEITTTEIKADFEECVLSARKDAEKNDVVLLSPACASFDMFNDFEHRGKVFKDLVNKLV